MDLRRMLDRLLSEMAGVFMLCFVGVLVIKNLGSTPDGLIGVAFGHGLAILVMVAALGHVSGGHFNPAVTIALLLGKKISPVAAGVYIVSQLLGGLLAALVISWTMGKDVVAGGTPALASGVGMGEGLLLEAIATFFLVLTVFGTAVDHRAPQSVYPAAIGLSITAGIFAIGPLTGAALNPARWFGPALVGGSLSDALVWIVGPIAGGVAAWALHDLIIRPAEEHPAVVESGEENTPR
jgi:MIP family channel proteins